MLATGVLHAQTWVPFDDDNLQSAMIEFLEAMEPPEPLTLASLEQLIAFVAQSKNIVLLGGIEQLSNLTILDLEDNDIMDISPLQTMTQLTSLSLDTNKITDISISNLLTGLTGLNLRSNAISNIGPLANLINLTDLDLISNEISDIGPLVNLINLTVLDMDFNAISDLTPLTDLINLTSMDLFNNDISDIGPLAGLTKLTVLSLSSNVISDIGPLTDLIQLTELDLISNPISDISALVNNTGLGAGDSIELTSTLLGLDDCADLQTLIDRGASVTHNVNCDATVLVANFMNGNLNSRVYLWNPSASAGNITVRVFTLPLSVGTAQELTAAPLDLGTLGAKSALNIKLAEDILFPLGISTPTTPYTTDGGNLVLEFTITAATVRGVAQVFSVPQVFLDPLAFGTYPLRVIQ